MQIKSKPCYFLALTLAPYRTEYTIFLFVFLFGWVVVVVLLWFFFLTGDLYHLQQGMCITAAQEGWGSDQEEQ